ncbi:MAG: response regulator transcription factor [Caldilineaceae bacterium]|nr:response regulator transcription factor [Caldilineaceae bacterium]
MIRVLIVHEIHLVCNALANVLRDEADMTVSGLASCPEDAMAQLQANNNCDLILLNVNRPCQEVLHFIHEVVQQNKDVKLLVVGVIEAEEFILQCFQAGAVGYALRDDTLEELLHKIRAAYRGRTFVSPEIAGALVSRVAELSKYVSNVDCDEHNFSLLSADLTPREREVLRHIERGYSNQEIADTLTIEVGTVKNHVHNILKKLNVDNRKRAAMLARQVLPERRIEKIEVTRRPSTSLAYGASQLYRREAERSAV